MPIHLNCPNGHALRVKDRLAGQSGSCPTCGAGFVVPAPADAAAQPSGRSAAPPAVPEEIGSSPEAEVEWRVALADGNQAGPTVPIVFSQWIAAGRVPPDAMVWRTGWEAWRRADESAAELPAPLPDTPTEAAAAPPPEVPSGVTLPPATTAQPAVEPTRASKSASEVNYTLRKKRQARQRRRFVVGLSIVCLLLATMLLGLVLTGPPTETPSAPQSTLGEPSR